MAKLGPVGVGDEPLVAVDDPLVAVLVGAGLDERRVRARHLGLGHGEAAHGPALAQRAQVALLLLVGAPVQQRVHVALVGRLAVEDPGPQPRLGRLGLDHGQLDVAEPHAAPLLGHVREPDARLLRLLAQPERIVRRYSSRSSFVGRRSRSSAGLDDVVDERADPEAELLELGGEGEVDAHGWLFRSRDQARSASGWAPASGWGRNPDGADGRLARRRGASSRRTGARPAGR